MATLIQLTLVTAALTVSAIAGNHAGAASRYALIALLALGMGIQNATARRLGVADLTTTVLTLTLTGIAADSRLAGGSGAQMGRRLLAVAAMTLGAFVGALLLIKVATALSLAVAAAILAIVCGASHPPAPRRERDLDVRRRPRAESSERCDARVASPGRRPS